jgi:hypothetical protein
MNTPISRRTALLLPLLGLPASWSAENSPADSRPRRPAPTLKPAASPTLPVDSRGFIHRWKVHEPIPVSGKLTQNDVEQLLRDTPYSASAAYPAHQLDTSGYNFNLYHFAWALSKPTSNVLFWITTTLEVPDEVQDVRLAIGSNAASVWWLDDERLVSIYNDRQTVIDDGVSRRLRLRKGRHEIRAAIVNGGGATDFCARFLREDGQPVTGLGSPLA